MYKVFMTISSTFICLLGAHNYRADKMTGLHEPYIAMWHDLYVGIYTYDGLYMYMLLYI